MRSIQLCRTARVSGGTLGLGLPCGALGGLWRACLNVGCGPYGFGIILRNALAHAQCVDLQEPFSDEFG